MVGEVVGLEVVGEPDGGKGESEVTVLSLGMCSPGCRSASRWEHQSARLWGPQQSATL